MFDIRGLFAGEKQLAGLDSVSSSIKLAEIQDTSRGRILGRFSQIPLAKGVIVDGTIMEPEALTAALQPSRNSTNNPAASDARSSPPFPGMPSS